MLKKHIKALDKIWGLKVRKAGICERCGRPANQPHHIFIRTNRSTRWDLDNGICLCFHHHRRAHDNGVEFTYWITKYKGKSFMYLLHKKSQEILKHQDYEEIRKGLEK